MSSLKNGVSGVAAFNTVNSSVRSKFNSATYFRTLDGFSVAFFFNPYCATGDNDRYYDTVTNNNIVSCKRYSLDIACMNVVYDMNGKQGPNRVGQDIGFVGSFYNGYGVKAVAVLPHKDEKAANNANLPGSGTNYWARAQQYCRELHENDWKVPDVEELSLMYLNRNVLRSSISNSFWSSVPVAGSASDYWYIAFYSAYYGDQSPLVSTFNVSGVMSVQCVRTNALK